VNISARVANQKGEHTVVLKTNEREHSLTISPKPNGFGSSANGGELLFLALATCYCNDLYREAQKRGISIERVQVEVSGEFGGEGSAASNISYRAFVDAKAPRQAIVDLMRHTDTVAEIQNTLRCASPVVLAECEAREV
jgi:uncharacterized OsmC-like protein